MERKPNTEPNTEVESNQEKNPLEDAKKYANYLKEMLNLLSDKNKNGKIGKEDIEAYIRGANEDLEDLRNSLDRAGK